MTDFKGIELGDQELLINFLINILSKPMNMLFLRYIYGEKCVKLAWQ